MRNKEANNNKERAHKVLLLTFLADPAARELALAYLKTYFLKYSEFSKRINILVLSLSINDKDEDVIERLANLKPEVIGFSCYVWSINKILVLSRKLKKASPGLKIVLGGPEVSPQANELLKQETSIDAVVVNEGEETFKELIENWLMLRRDLNAIKGISFKRNGEIINNPPRDLINPLGRIPSPYLNKVIAFDKKNAVLETMRGCGFSCGYCYYNKQFKNLRYFPLERIKKELKLLLESNVGTIYLMDPTFNLKKGRSIEILDYFLKFRKNSKLHLEIKAEFLDEELVEKLYRAGIEFLEIGLQTINKKALKNVRRSFDPRLFRRNINLLNKRNIKYSIQLIVGLPGDDYEGFKASLDWVFGLEPPLIEIFKLMVLPGTSLRSNSRHFKIKFEIAPPYFVRRSFSFSSKELEKMENLGKTALFFYKYLFSYRNISLLCRLLGLSFSGLCEEWQEWQELNQKDITKKYDLQLPGRAVLEAAMFNIRLTELAEEFTAFIFKKRSNTFIPQSVLKTQTEDNRKFLEDRGVFKEKLGACLN